MASPASGSRSTGDRSGHIGTVTRLTPARYEQLGSEPFMPRIPWKSMSIGLAAVVALVSAYWYKEQRKAEALRAAILQVHEHELSRVTRRYRPFRRKLEDRIIAAAARAPTDYADPRLGVAALHTGRGLYLRLHISQAANRRSVSEGARQMNADAIPACLGLAPASARGLFEQGAFLGEAWIEEARTTDSVARLRVIDDELARRIRRDLPSVMELLQSDWFLLVLQHGRKRADAAVDVFLWDLRQGSKLLSARVQPRGELLPFRFVTKGAPAAPRIKPSLRSAGATDCSIAAQIKELAGEPVLNLQSRATVQR
ncbi:MAG: hypothetical protein MJD61_14095 [Proteobacteria bacterium]|nr:hypothetical protein [Pseudomonadota bacterium]